MAQTRFPALCADHDVVLAHRLPHSPPWPTTVSVTRLLREPLDVAVPAGHPLAARPTVSVDEVTGLPWIGVHEGFPLLAPLEAIAAAGGRPLTIAHRVNDFTVSAALVAAGAGLALMPRYTAPLHPDVVLRPLGDLDLARHVDALVRPERRLRRTVGEVLDVLARAAAELTEE